MPPSPRVRWHLGSRPTVAHLAMAAIVASLLAACGSTGKTGTSDGGGLASNQAVTVVALGEEPTVPAFIISPIPPPPTATARPTSTPPPSPTPLPTPTEAVTAGTAAGTANPAEVTADEYAVLSAVLRADYVVGGQRRLVLQDTTVAPPLGAGQVAALESAGGPEVVADFQARNHAVAPLANKLSVALPITLVKREDLDRLMADPSGSRFERRYPRANGYVAVSRVGFDATGDTAMVYVAHNMGVGVGRGTVFVLVQTDGRWEVADAYTVWVK